MKLKSETKVIEGLKVTTQQFPALRSFSLFTKLGKVIAPVLSKLTGVGELSGNMDVSALAPALAELFSNLESVESTELAKEILAMTTVVRDGSNFELLNDGEIDAVFTGRFKAFLLTMVFAIQVNYKDFFVGALGSVHPSASKDRPENQQDEQSD